MATTATFHGTYSDRGQHPVRHHVGDHQHARAPRPSPAPTDLRSPGSDGRPRGQGNDRCAGAGSRSAAGATATSTSSARSACSSSWPGTGCSRSCAGSDDGPHATNPIGFTTGLWMATWLLQVMPLFFYVGGYAHLHVVGAGPAPRRADLARSSAGGSAALAVPALALLGVWVALGDRARASCSTSAWIGRAVMLVVSPLWFLGRVPDAGRAAAGVPVAAPPVRHDRAGVAGGVRRRGRHPPLPLRPRVRWRWSTWSSSGACATSSGSSTSGSSRATRRTDWTLLWAGLAGLAGWSCSGLYPGSMVGVPGEASNMAPPTLCIVALVLFQAGVAEVIRPAMERRLRPAAVGAGERDDQPLLDAAVPVPHHGMALERAVRYALAGQRQRGPRADARRGGCTGRWRSSGRCCSRCR